MNATALLLVYGGLFVGVLLLVEGLYHLLAADGGGAGAGGG